MDKEVREELIDQLLREQGHLCAYCMSKIPESRNLPSGVPAVTIEHWRREIQMISWILDKV